MGKGSLPPPPPPLVARLPPGFSVSLHAIVISFIMNNNDDTPIASRYALSTNPALRNLNLAQRGSQGEDLAPSLHIPAGTPLTPTQTKALASIERAVRTFGPAPGAAAMLTHEDEAAVIAAQTGRYVTWRSLKDGQDCCRVGPSARCFCGYTFEEHAGDGLGRCSQSDSCTRFLYMPSRPEEVGEWWLPRRKGFNVHHWRAKCQCGHGHNMHTAVQGGRCRGRVAPPVKAAAPRRRIENHGHPNPNQNPKALAESEGRPCGCRCFVSAFRCVVCESSWEDHELVVETEAERRAQGREVRDAYRPLAAAPSIREAVFGDDSRRALPDPSSLEAALRPAWRPSPDDDQSMSQAPQQHGATEHAFASAMRSRTSAKGRGLGWR